MNAAATMRALPVGDHGLLIELGTGEEAEALHAELLRRRAAGTLPPVRDIVPAARTVLLEGLEHLSRERGDILEIPVRYDGPDLAEVAGLWGVAVDEVAGIHSAAGFRVAFCGFAPGFGYLTGLAERWSVPRRATPRTSVPPGSVALAGPYTGVYPRASPGGWQIIGTTDTVLWDPGRARAALLAPGTRVRFVPEGSP